MSKDQAAVISRNKTVNLSEIQRAIVTRVEQ